MKTKAAILFQQNSPLVVDEVEIPRLKKGQALVKIFHSGVCRAQYNEMIGLKGPDKFLPHLLGHEGAGEIVDCGPGITKVKKGDYVILSWIKGNGLEAPRSEYKLGSRTVNAGAVTTFSEYSVVSENRITKISRKISSDKAAVIGCAIATGAGIINNTLKAGKQDSVAVFGAGGIGASAILAAKAKGCRVIVGVDVNKAKLEFAKKMGATHTVNAADENPLDEIHKILKGGVTFAIDASGQKSAMETAFASLAYPGTLVIAGNLSKDERISLHPFELIKGKKLVGTWGGETVPQKDFAKYINAHCQGRFPLEKLITHRLKLDDINFAFKLLKEGEAGRVIIEL